MKKILLLLDSSKEDENLSKYSFIGINPFMKFEVKNDKYIYGDNIVEGDPFKILEESSK